MTKLVDRAEEEGFRTKIQDIGFSAKPQDRASGQRFRTLPDKASGRSLRTTLENKASGQSFRPKFADEASGQR